MPESDQSPFPSEMKRVAPPEGATMYKISHGEGNQFGVTEVLYGRIRTFQEKPLEPTEYVDGTLVCFNPGVIQVHVTRRNLSAADINFIGQNTMELVQLGHIRRYLPEAIKSTQELVSRLRHMGSANLTWAQDNETIDAENINSIEDLGVILSRLKSQAEAQGNRYHDILLEAGKLGVSLIEMFSTGLGSEMPPLVAKKEKQQANEPSPQS